MRRLIPAAVACLAAALQILAAHAEAGDPPAVVTTQAIPGATVFADIAGMTLYVFDKDQPGKPTCVGDCARDWTPLPAAWAANASGDWTIVNRSDGQRQWAFHGKPLYRFAGDRQAGEANGDGREGAWHAVVTARQFLPPGTTIWHSDFGPAFATAGGKTLYVLAELRFNPLGTKRHTGPNLGLTECDAACTRTWQPFVAAGDAAPGGDWTIVTRPDGVRQWAYKDWPVFTNVADGKPGDTFGEGVTTVKGGLTGLSWQVATLL
jgi:predicted lipoprotein with Yx(FWY)xxD motif